jgi:cytochrome c biogenesis protein CcdA
VKRWAVGAAVLWLFAGTAAYAQSRRGGGFGQDSAGLEKIEAFRVTVSPAEAKAGYIVTATVEFRLKEGWHVYAINKEHELGQATKFTFPAEGPVEIAGKIEETPPREYRQEGLEDIPQWIQEGEIRYEIPLRIRPGTPAGKVAIAGEMYVYICSSVCLDATKAFDIELSILPGGAEAAPAPPPLPPPPQPPTPPPPPAPAQPEEPKEGDLGFLAFLGLCVAGGLLSLIQPCVYPIIPITISYFVKEGAGSRPKTALLAYMYALGIVVTFTALGLFLALTFGTQGAREFAQNAWVNLGIAVLFVAFALSLFGLFELRLPSFITEAATGKRRSGTFGAFLLGLAFTVVTFTCTIPIAALVLGFAAVGQFAWALPGMLVYSGTMALPFIALGMFPGLVARVPKGGGWLHEAKIAGGFLELAIAVMYFARADYGWSLGYISRDLALVIWTVCMGLTAIYLLGLFRWKEDVPVERVGLSRAMLGGLFAAAALFFHSGIGSRPLGPVDFLLPKDDVADQGGPHQAVAAPLRSEIRGIDARLGEIEKKLGIDSAAQPTRPPEEWLSDYGKAREIARRGGWPVFVDFTGFT